MTLETTKKAATDVATQTMKAADTAIKKAWSIMDAATEKQSPSEYLSQKAVNSIQGQG
jgi:hypothetical protein